MSSRKFDGFLSSVICDPRVVYSCVYGSFSVLWYDVLRRNI